MFPPIEPEFPQKPQPARMPPQLPQQSPQQIFISAAPPPRRGMVRRYLPVLIWMAVIFLASTTLGRPENSEAIVDPILKFLGFKQIDAAHIVVRKLGHVAEYAIFALLLAYFFLSSSRPALRRWWFALALSGVILYACSDEYHQSFVPERVASAIDVMLDAASGAVALACLAAFRFLFVPREDYSSS